MALTPTSIPGNLWGQGVQGRTFPAGLITNTLLAREELKLRKQKMLTDIVSSLDPIEFLSNKNTIEQARRIEGFEDFITKISSDNRGNFSQQDLLDAAFMAKNISIMAEKEKAYVKQYEQVTKIFNESPEEYDAAIYTAGNKIILTDGEYIDPWKLLVPAFLDLENFGNSITTDDIYGDDSWATTENTYDNKEAGTKTTSEEKRWGVLTTDASGKSIIDEEATKTRGRRKLMSSIIQSPRAKRTLEEEYANLNPQIKETFDRMAMEIRNEGLLASDQWGQANEAALYYAADKYASTYDRRQGGTDTVKTITAPEEKEQ